MLQFKKSATIILCSITLVLWVTVFIFDKISDLSSLLIWSVFACVQLVINAVCGSVINRLHNCSNNDELTGLWNRRFFHRRLGEELKRVKKTGDWVSLIYIDVDNFKRINDTNGHVFGDMVLRRLADILKANCRGVDTVARWGGEEFVIILPGTDVKGAVAFADRLRRTVETSDLGFPTTVSIGISTTQATIDPECFLLKADEALYKAKENKNCVVISEQTLLAKSF